MTSAAQSAWRVAVIGGGLSGLAAAHRLVELGSSAGQACEVTLFEGAPRLGGAIETRRIGDYLVESGADSFITNKPWGVELCQRLGVADRLIPTDATYRRSLVLSQGRPVEVPEGFTLLAPTRIGAVLASPIFSAKGKARLVWEYFVPRRQGDTDESLADFVRRRFGREVFERLVQPLVGGIYTSDPEKLSLRATLPRFIEMERRHGSLIRALRAGAGSATESDEAASGARYGLFASFAGGMSELIEALGQSISGAVKLRANTKVVAVEHDSGADRGWSVKLADGSSEHYDGVIVALPTYLAADVLGRCDAELASELRRIEYASSAVVVTGHALADVTHPVNAFGLVIPTVERRKVLAVSFASRKFPGRAPSGRIQLRTFVGGALQPEMLDCSDAELTQVVQSELGELLGVRRPPEFVHITRYVRAMPQYHVGHVELVERIERRTATHNGLELAGNAYRGVGIPDSIHSGEGAAERLFKQRCLRSPETAMASNSQHGE